MRKHRSRGRGFALKLHEHSDITTSELGALLDDELEIVGNPGDYFHFEKFDLGTYLDENGVPVLTPEIVHNSLLRSNFLPHFNGRNPELPPIFSSDTFGVDVGNELAEHTSQNSKREKLGFDFLRYSQTKNDGHARHSGIPHPMPYSALAKKISEEWGSLSFLTKNPNSSLRPALTKDGRIFASNYSENMVEKASWFEENSKGKKFHLKLDINQFFPSIYTHSFCWVPEGIEAGKRSFSDTGHTLKGHFTNELDRLAQKTNRKQTIGLIVGPGTSNVLAEYVLSAVDKSLRKKFGETFRRYIDDYDFFATNETDVELFKQALEHELREFELLLNPRKTRISDMSLGFEAEWISRLELSAQLLIDFNPKRGSTFWSLVLDEYSKNHDQKILRWGMSALLNRAHSTEHALWSYSFLINQVSHFPYLAPYLSRVVDESAFLRQSDFDTLRNTLINNFDRLYSDAKVWITFILVHNRQLNVELARRAVETRDALLIALLDEHSLIEPSLKLDWQKSIKSFIYDEDKMWLPAYQDYLRGTGPLDSDGCFEILKNGDVDFIDPKYRHFKIPF